MQDLQDKQHVEFLKKILERPVVLVGMMGSGKSHLGYELAKTLDMDFYDSDSLIEEKAGCTITEIFEQFGEQKFREFEHKTILELLGNGPCVVATGGGAVMNADTLSAIKEKSFSVWLNTHPDEILKRLEGDTTRPLLKNDDPAQVLNDLLKKRTPLYEQADIIINIGHKNVQETVAELIKALSEHLNAGTFQGLNS